MKKERREYGRRFRLQSSAVGPYYVNRDNGEVRVIPPPENGSVTTWIVHAHSTSRGRSAFRTEVTQPNAEDRAFAIAAGIINDIRSHQDDD